MKLAEDNDYHKMIYEEIEKEWIEAHEALIRDLLDDKSENDPSTT